MQGLAAVNLMLMAHTIKISDSSNVQHVFDLKGSWENRKVEVHENTPASRTLKDTNLVEML
jgi:hypothetical protein